MRNALAIGLLLGQAAVITVAIVFVGCSREPQTYEDCVLKAMEGSGKSDAALQLIQSVCREKFPLPPHRDQVAGGEAGSDQIVDRQEIESVLQAYLPKLGQAYASRDTSILEGIAVPKEMARIQLRTEELTATGRVYEPEFKEVTVEDISVWNYANAFVTTFEVWDVRSFTLGTHLLVNESLDQRNRVKYQMKRKRDGWVILYRELDQTFDQ